MLCPNNAFWRAWLDRRSARQIRRDCRTPGQLRQLPGAAGRITRNAKASKEALVLLGPTRLPTPLTTGVARRRLSGAMGRDQRRRPALSSMEQRSMSATLSFRRARATLVGLAAALVLTFAVGTPEGRTALAAFLAQFRSQSLAVVSFDSNPPRRPLSELSQLGDLQSKPSGRPNGRSEVDRRSEPESRIHAQPTGSVHPTQWATQRTDDHGDSCPRNSVHL